MLMLLIINILLLTFCSFLYLLTLPVGSSSILLIMSRLATFEVACLFTRVTLMLLIKVSQDLIELRFHLLDLDVVLFG